MKGANEREKAIFENLKLTKDDLSIYYLDGTEIDRHKKLEITVQKPQDHK